MHTHTYTHTSSHTHIHTHMQHECRYKPFVQTNFVTGTHEVQAKLAHVLGSKLGDTERARALLLEASVSASDLGLFRLGQKYMLEAEEM